MIRQADVSQIPKILTSLGMIPIAPAVSMPSGYVPVLLDGKIIGHLPPALLAQVADKLRYLKVIGTEGIPKDIEIAHMPLNTSSHAGLYLFGCGARMVRPVLYLPTKAHEYIGPLEQEHLTIAVLDEDVVSGIVSFDEKY